MKIKRTKKDYGGGSGRGIYESETFRAVLWDFGNDGFRTTIKCKLSDDEIHFDGKQEFISDKTCMEQFTVKEILQMVRSQKEISFKNGLQSKINELKNCLEL